MCKAEPPTTDLDTLDKLFRTLKKLDGHAETRSSLWEKAAKAKPQDLELQLEWFNSAFESDDWKSAQKVSWINSDCIIVGSSRAVIADNELPEFSRLP